MQVAGRVHFYALNARCILYVRCTDDTLQKKKLSDGGIISKNEIKKRGETRFPFHCFAQNLREEMRKHMYIVEKFEQQDRNFVCYRKFLVEFNFKLM